MAHHMLQACHMTNMPASPKVSQPCSMNSPASPSLTLTYLRQRGQPDTSIDQAPNLEKGHQAKLSKGCAVCQHSYGRSVGGQLLWL